MIRSAKHLMRRSNAALATGDLGGAEQAAQVYLNTPGADPAVVAKWSQQMWELVSQQRQSPRSASKEGTCRGDSERCAGSIPSMRKMSKATSSFYGSRNRAASRAPRCSPRSRCENQELDLAIRRQEVRLASLKLDRLSAINDATIARCGCDGRTNVGIAETNFPLYLVRLDPETQRSEVLILPHRQ